RVYSSPMLRSESSEAGSGQGGPPLPPLGLGGPPGDSLQRLYRWSVETRRSVAAWRLEESRFLWPLLGAFIALLVVSQAVAVLLFSFGQASGPWSLTLNVVINAVPWLSAIVAWLLLWAFFRSRDRRLNRPQELALEPSRGLPPNLIEASLVELDATDLALKSIYRRLWWIVVLIGILSIVVGEFTGVVLLHAYVAANGTGVTTADEIFEFQYGLGLVIAAVPITWSAFYWRRVERRLAALQESTTSRRAAVVSFEQTLWNRV
ncbi:MAG: hypothetical protein L3J97_05285, partial [Thermoplasmata archaeon]|nr:hypothetical protein [Thermoplasmata archaeon]